MSNGNNKNVPNNKVPQRTNYQFWLIATLVVLIVAVV